MAKETRLFFGKTALAIANPLVRRAMGDHFRHRGAEDILYLDDWQGLYETLKEQSIGVLVVDDTLSERMTSQLVRDIRNGVLHDHPFPLVIMLAHRRGEQHLREMIDSGPDAIVLAPVSITDLFSKIDHFAAGRKPFVVTRDYIGPDRRGAPRDGVAAPLMIEAPNPLTAGTSPESFHRAVTESLDALKVAQMECSLGQLAFALRSGDLSDLSGVIAALEQMANARQQPAIKEAVAGLIDALRERRMADIMTWCQKLLAANRR